jgi:hypothetical protein
MDAFFGGSLYLLYGQHQTTGAKRGEAQTRPGPMQGAHAPLNITEQTKYMKRKEKRKVRSTVDEKREEVERDTWRNGRCQLVVIKECEIGSSEV